MKQILAMTLKELKVFSKDRGAVIVTFLMPFMFILIMSSAASGGGGPDAADPISLIAVDEDGGELATTIIDSLGEIEAFDVQIDVDGVVATREYAESVIEADRDVMVLVIPMGLADMGDETRLELIADPATSVQLVGPVQGAIQGAVESAVFMSSLPKGALEEMVAGMEGGSSIEVARVAPAAMDLGDDEPDNAYQVTVPGYTIFGIFWIVSILASSVLAERRDGTFRRLLVAPMNRATMLAGKLIPHFMVNVVQITLMFATAAILFGLSLGADPTALILLSLAAAASATGLGVLVSAFVRTEAQAGGLTTLLLLTMAAIGGCFIPRFAMPDWMASIGMITPHAWALDGYHDLLVRGSGLSEVLPEIAAVTAFAVAFFAIGVWRFKFE